MWLSKNEKIDQVGTNDLVRHSKQTNASARIFLAAIDLASKEKLLSKKRKRFLAQELPGGKIRYRISYVGRYCARATRGAEDSRQEMLYTKRPPNQD